MVAFASNIKQEVEQIWLRLPNGGWNDDQFFEFCQLNDGLKIERLSTGQLIIMALTGGKTGIRNSELNAEFVIWNRKKRQGKVFDSSTGFKIPNGAVYSPDVAWVENEKWDALTEKQKEKFAPLCPDFICELASSNKQMSWLKDKMQEFKENGCRLGWLIDPYKKVTYVYRPDSKVEKIPFDKTLSGEKVLKGLRIKMTDLLDI